MGVWEWEWGGLWGRLWELGREGGGRVLNTGVMEKDGYRVVVNFEVV